MKYKLLFLLFLLFFCNIKNSIQTNIKPNQNLIIMSDSTFQLSLKLIHRETSKDCNSSTTTINIVNGLITISKNYGGFKAPEDTYQEKELAPELLTKIYQLIEKENLNINITEQNETGGLGIAGHLSLELTGTYNSEINISGKTNIWGTDEYVKQNWGRQYVDSRTNIQNIEFFSKANTLITLIEEF